MTSAKYAPNNTFNYTSSSHYFFLSFSFCVFHLYSH